MKLQMRYWDRAPEPGSLQEEIALTVEAFEEFRSFEYFTAIMVSQLYASAQNKDGFDATMKLVKALQDKFFPTGDTTEDGAKVVAEGDQKEFLDLMENTFAVVHGDRLRKAAAKEHQQELPPNTPLIYNENPKGELLE